MRGKRGQNYLGGGMSGPPAPNIPYAGAAAARYEVGAASTTINPQKFPNPATRECTIGHQGIFSCKIVDQPGRKVGSGKGNIQAVVGSRRKPGVYLIRITRKG